MNLDQMLDREDMFFTQIQDWSFTWRLLSWKEYRRFDALRAAGAFDLYYLYVKVFQRCYDGDFYMLSQKMPMFIPISLGHLIMYLSGDCEADTIKHDIVTARQNYNGHGMIETLKRFILIAYPSYKPNELDALNRTAIIKLFVQAEELLAFKHGKDYQAFDVSTIMTAAEMEAKAKKIEPAKRINFDLENETIRRNVSPWGEIDLIEKEYEASKAATLSPEQASKLDRLPRR